MNLEVVAVVLGILVSLTVLLGAVWGAVWAVDGKIRKIRDWLRDEIEDTVHRSTATLRPNGGRSVGDLPDLVHNMRRENEEQHRHIGDRLTVVEERTEALMEDAERLPCHRPGDAWGRAKRTADI